MCGGRRHLVMTSVRHACAAAAGAVVAHRGCAGVSAIVRPGCYPPACGGDAVIAPCRPQRRPAVVRQPMRTRACPLPSAGRARHAPREHPPATGSGCPTAVAVMNQVHPLSVSAISSRCCMGPRRRRGRQAGAVVSAYHRRLVKTRRHTQCKHTFAITTTHFCRLHEYPKRKNVPQASTSHTPDPGSSGLNSAPAHECRRLAAVFLVKAACRAVAASHGAAGADACW